MDTLLADYLALPRPSTTGRCCRVGNFGFAPRLQRAGGQGDTFAGFRRSRRPLLPP